MSRFHEIAFPEFRREIQLPLFGSSEKEDFSYPWPEYSQGLDSIQEIIDNVNEPYLGLDLEFDTKTKRCSIFGLATRDKCASAPFDINQARETIHIARKKGIKLVGFSVCGAEKEILEHNLNQELELDLFEDSMILFHLCNSHLTKSSGGKEDGEKGTLGFINLYTCSTIYTDIPNWKMCRENECSGPCPRCDVWGYNAVDSWVGLVAFHRLLSEAEKYGLTYQFYRDVLTLTHIAQQMRNNGINVDRDLARDLDKVSDEEKQALFQTGGVFDVIPFSPTSQQEALEYFKANKIPLKNYTKPELFDMVKKLAKKHRMSEEEYINWEEIPEVEKWLVKAAQFKGMGKGFKGWFDQKYFGIDGFLHPRSNTTGTQTGRWSHSSPNYANMPGFKED